MRFDTRRLVEQRSFARLRLVHVSLAADSAPRQAISRPAMATRRAGFSLVVALVSMAITGTLIAALFFASMEEARAGRNRLLRTRALTAAEYGQNAVIAEAQRNPTSWRSSLAKGSVAVRTFSPGDGSVDTVRVTRLGDRSFLIVSEGRAGGGTLAQASRRIGTLVQLVSPAMVLPAALTTRSGASLTGPAQLSGDDSPIPGWHCPAAGTAAAGVAMADASRFDSDEWCAGGDCVSGDPSVLESASAADTSSHFTYGDVHWSDLTAIAKRVGAGSLPSTGPSYRGDGSCDVSSATNWGDPARNPTAPGGCEDYFPVLYAPGDLTLGAGSGQGILLVEGDLQVQGGFEFFGPVIVRGQLRTAGSGAHFHGGVMAGDAVLGADKRGGITRITYSSCAIVKALAGSATPRVARGRAWVELFR